MRIGKTNLSTELRQACVIALAAISVTLFTKAAHADCFDHARAGSAPALSQPLVAGLSAIPNSSSNSIAGLWRATYTTSDNQPFQESFDMWHNDGTELETANVNPITGNFCMGVWKQVGSKIHLHHVGWAFDNLGNLVGPFTMDDVLELGKGGNTYSGNFEFKQYDSEGNLVQQLTGTITATRIGVN